jgi:hypothetical protein
MPPAPEPDFWLGRVLYRNPIARSLRDRRNNREGDFVARHEADVKRKQSGT